MHASSQAMPFCRSWFNLTSLRCTCFFSNITTTLKTVSGEGCSKSFKFLLSYVHFTRACFKFRFLCHACFFPVTPTSLKPILFDYCLITVTAIHLWVQTVQIRCYPGSLQTKHVLQQNTQHRSRNPRRLLNWGGGGDRQDIWWIREGICCSTEEKN